MSLISATVVTVVGLVLLALLVLQILVGLRKIKFKGRTHLKVHRWIAYGMLAIALFHAVIGLALFGYLSL